MSATRFFLAPRKAHANLHVAGFFKHRVAMRRLCAVKRTAYKPLFLRYESFVNTSIALGLVICVSGFQAFRSSGSEIWQKTSPSNTWSALACSADGKVLVAASNPSRLGQIYVSAKSGLDWSVTPAPAANWMSVACSADGTTMLAAAYGDA